MFQPYDDDVVGIDANPDLLHVRIEDGQLWLSDDARQDIEIVFAKTGLVPTPVFDTQIAAMVCGFGESISYVNLVKKVTGVWATQLLPFYDARAVDALRDPRAKAGALRIQASSALAAGGCWA